MNSFVQEVPFGQKVRPTFGVAKIMVSPLCFFPFPLTRCVFAPPCPSSSPPHPPSHLPFLPPFLLLPLHLLLPSLSNFGLIFSPDLCPFLTLPSAFLSSVANLQTYAVWFALEQPKHYTSAKITLPNQGQAVHTTQRSLKAPGNSPASCICRHRPGRTPEKTDHRHDRLHACQTAGRTFSKP